MKKPDNVEVKKEIAISHFNFKDALEDQCARLIPNKGD